MTNLTDRQLKLLNTIVKEYIDTAQPVGSENLVQKHGLGVSSATVRNEMAWLEESGFLRKTHTSAGREPTLLTFRLFIKELMQEEALPVVNEVALRQRLWNERGDQIRLLRQAVSALAEETKHLSLIVTEDGHIFSAGSANILRYHEFYDIDLTRSVLELLDQFEMMSALFNKMPADQEFGVLLGEECGVPALSSCGIVFARLDLSRGKGGTVGVLGPMRLRYEKVVPMVKYMRDLVSELARGW